MLPLSVLRAVPDLMGAWKGMAMRLAGAWGADPPRPWAKTQGPGSIRAGLAPRAEGAVGQQQV